MNYFNIKISTIGSSILQTPHILEYLFNRFLCFSLNIDDIYFTFSKLFIDPFNLHSLISKGFILSLE